MKKDDLMKTIQELMETGIIIIDKPPGPTSHEVTSWVAKILHVRKSGHAGTLDPEVTGVLPVALNRATKMLQYITKQRKTYVGILKFKDNVCNNEIEKIFNLFIGEIIQLPPVKSAVKRVPRKRNIYTLKLLENDGKRVLFSTEVEAGTYIRAIARDINIMLGQCKLEELRRVSIGNINAPVKLQDVVDAYWLWQTKHDATILRKYIRPVIEYIELPKVIVNNNTVSQLSHGAPLFAPGIVSCEKKVKANQCVVLYTQDNRFIGVHMTADNIKNIKRGIFSVPKTILLEPINV